MAWSGHFRSASQLFFASVAAYLINALVGARLLVSMVEFTRTLESSTIKLLLAAVVVDGSKVLGLAVAAALVGPAVRLSPALSAVVLVALAVGWELAVATVLGQLDGFVTSSPVLLCRLAMWVLLFWATRAVFSWRSAKMADGSQKANNKADASPKANDKADAPPAEDVPGPNGA